MSASVRSHVRMIYDVLLERDDWELPEIPVPEAAYHDQTLDLLKALLLAWVARAKLDAQVARNLAVRWVEAKPKIGVDPDVCLIVPRTPEGDDLTSLCTWRPGHAAPKLAIEVVSIGHPYKDYVIAPAKYADAGVDELVIFDPKLAGAATTKLPGGPFRIQVWQRQPEGDVARVYAGEGPAFSRTLNAWLFAVADGERLRVADDREGTRWWRTGEESEREAKAAALASVDVERAAKEAERAAKEAERAAKEAALAKVAALEAELAKLRGGS